MHHLWKQNIGSNSFIRVIKINSFVLWLVTSMMFWKATWLNNEDELQSQKVLFYRSFVTYFVYKTTLNGNKSRPSTPVKEGSRLQGLPAHNFYHLYWKNLKKRKSQIELHVVMPLKQHLLLPLNPSQLLHFLKCLMQIKKSSFLSCLLLFTLPLADSHFWQCYQVNFGKRNLKVFFFKIISVYFTSVQEC